MVHESDLPVPDAAFRWCREPWGHTLRCQPLARIAQHVFTTRQLQLRGADGHAVPWMQAVAAVGATSDDLVRAKQVHGRTIRVIRPGADKPAEVAIIPEADVVMSDHRGIVAAVQVADCVPLLMADPRSGAVAAVHAGWRGTLAGVAAAAVDRMTREFGTRASDLIAAIGPSIGPCCYEVGGEVVDAFAATGASDAQMGRWFIRADDSVHLDLWSVTRDQLTAAGVTLQHIHICRLCSKTHSHIFASYRADGPTAGRMAALIKVAALEGE